MSLKSKKNLKTFLKKSAKNLRKKSGKKMRRPSKKVKKSLRSRDQKRGGMQVDERLLATLATLNTLDPKYKAFAKYYYFATLNNCSVGEFYIGYISKQGKEVKDST